MSGKSAAAAGARLVTRVRMLLLLFFPWRVAATPPDVAQAYVAPMAYGLRSTPSPARVHGDTTLLVSGRAIRAHASAPDDVGVGRGEEAREDVLGHRRVVLEVRRDPAGHRYQVELGEVLDRLGTALDGVDLADRPS